MAFVYWVYKGRSELRLEQNVWNNILLQVKYSVRYIKTKSACSGGWSLREGKKSSSITRQRLVGGRGEEGGCAPVCLITRDLFLPCTPSASSKLFLSRHSRLAGNPSVSVWNQFVMQGSWLNHRQENTNTSLSLDRCTEGERALSNEIGGILEGRKRKEKSRLTM